VVITYRTVVELPPDRQVVNVASATGEGRELDDAFGPLQTVDHAEAVIATQPEADLGITKSDDDASVRAVGDRYTYRLEATNAGPSPATGVFLSDDLDPRVRFVGSSDGCTAEVGLVTCAVGDLAVGASVTRTFEVEVVTLPGEGQTIPNIAVVHGTHPDPDCDPDHPQARCNADDEETPQVSAPTTTTAPETTTTIAAGPPRVDPTPRAFPRTGWSPLAGIALGGGLVVVGLVLVRRRRAAP
jgi:uncharacterized repeat protein (TIGR01451 family)